MTIIDISAERDKRNAPDPDCVITDEEGKDWFLFSLEYRQDGRRMTTDLWAVSREDAEAKVAAMRDSLVFVGQTVAVVPA